MDGSGLMNMLEAAALFAAAARRVSGAEHAGLEKAASIIEDGAKTAIGGYSFGWPALQPETVARKATGDSPLLETGELRASITHEVEGRRAIVGATSPVAAFMEFGTSRGIPPRPFIWGSWIHHDKEAIAAVGDAIVKAIKP
jgi:phage gpG-like protein